MLHMVFLMFQPVVLQCFRPCLLSLLFPTFYHIISYQKLFYTHKLPIFFQTPNFLQTSNFFQELNTPSASVLMMFTIYGSNVAVDFDIIEHAVATNHPHIFKTLYYGNLVYFLFHQTCFI